jgi:hypothetical protein
MSHWRIQHTLFILGISVLIIVIGLLVPPEQRFWSWISILFLLTLSFLVTGHGVRGIWNGIFIDGRNRMSLSWLQMVLWTLLVLSGFFAAGLSNLVAGAVDPLAIAIPEELWFLMGISTTSLVASPMILNSKKKQQPTNIEHQETVENLASRHGVSVTNIKKRFNHEGLIIKYNAPDHARFSDFFTGEETGNAGALDLSRLQMFYFTLILVLAYTVQIGSKFLEVNPSIRVITDFPALPASMVALLGISHAGYLIKKAAQNSQTEPLPPPEISKGGSGD